MVRVRVGVIRDRIMVRVMFRVRVKVRVRVRVMVRVRVWVRVWVRMMVRVRVQPCASSVPASNSFARACTGALISKTICGGEKEC